MTKRLPTNGSRSKEPSAAGQRLQSAGIRATDAYVSVRRHADKITEELDEVTAPHGVQTTELHDEDSLVTTVAEVIAANSK